MPESSFSKNSRGYSRRGEKKGGVPFWLIFIVVTSIMTFTVYFFIPKGASKPQPVEGQPGVKVPPPNQDPADSRLPQSIQEMISRAKDALAKQDWRTARDIMRGAMPQIPPDSPDWGPAAEILGKANIEIFYSKTPVPEKESYAIKPGDNLIKIASRFNISLEALQKSNGLDPTSPVIHAGKMLSIYKGTWQVTIDKSRFRLCLMDGINLFKAYRIGLGPRLSPPPGVYEIRAKEKDPVWYSDGKAIPYGADGNIIGTRWMSIRELKPSSSQKKGTGIHGTWQPSEIGRIAGGGSVKMFNSDIEELYSIIPVKVIVIVKE